jgi:hypothetical protein
LRLLGLAELALEIHKIRSNPLTALIVLDYLGS